MKLASFGEIIWDVYENERTLGGAPLNFAAHAALYGFDAYLFSAVGNDELGKEATAAVQKLGVKTDFIKTRPYMPTGRCNVRLDGDGVPTYTIEERSAYDEIDADSCTGQSFDVIAFGTLALRYPTNVETLESILGGCSPREIYADLNIRAPYYSRASVEFSLKNATTVKISSEELGTVASLIGIEYKTDEDAAEKIASLFPTLKLVIITLGERGSFALDTRESKIYRADAVKTSVVSTVGAGDSFGAAFLASYLKNRDIEKALRTAAHVSAYVVASMEAVPSGTEEVFWTAEKTPR